MASLAKPDTNIEPLFSVAERGAVSGLKLGNRSSTLRMNEQLRMKCVQCLEAPDTWSLRDS